MKNFVYDFFRWLAIILGYPLQLIFFKRKTYYENNVKRKGWKKGGALVISNHYNVLDYFLNMFLVAPRKLNVVTSEMPYQNKFLSFGMKFVGGIQANRITRDMSFMNKSAEVISKGQLVQIYPEGRNTPDGNIHPFKRSYVVIAHRANAPIIPIVTDGNYGFFKRASVIIGNPINVADYITTTSPMPTKEELNRANEIIFNKILALKQQLEELKASSRKSKRNSKQ
ncbi:MAG: 1-acyl-sn-glycerol-3-phosphate acyltransferase [Clostridiales bacterium]|nr:1-acyl-sn-glycerol-3-phosphate acyltransferase [Clostridiales bacterium]